MHSICIDNSGLTGFFDWLLSDLNTIVDNEKRVVCSQHLVVQGNSVQVLFQQRFQHLVVLSQSFLLLFDCQKVQQHLVVSFEEIVQVLEFFVFLRS